MTNKPKKDKSANVPVPKAMKSVGRPPTALPSKPDGSWYTPDEVARILMTTTPRQLQDWQDRKQE